MGTILDDFAGEPRHKWQQIWRGSPDVPRMLPDVLRDQFLEVGADGVSTVIKPAVDLSPLPTRAEWDEVFPLPVESAPPATYTPAGKLIPPRMMQSPGYRPLIASRGRIPTQEEGAWGSDADYEAFVAERRKREAALDALAAPYTFREECWRTVDMALGHVDCALADGQATRPDLDLWWERIAMYAPEHPILAHRAWIDERTL